MTDGDTVRDLIRDNLFRLIATLSGFLVASAVVLIADAPAWSKLVAALLALVSLFLTALWLPLPWSEWTNQRGRRLILAAAPLAVAGLVIVLGVTVWDGGSRVTTEPATLILLDASGTMHAPLEQSGDDTKFDDATAQLSRHVRDLASHQLGMATFGTGTCEADPPAEELVSIGHDTADEIRGKAEDLSPEGDANLVSAARYAIGSLQEFTDGRRLLIITGGLDRCGGDLAELVDETMLTEVSIQWELVGLGLTDEEKEQLTALPSGVITHIADSREELEEVLDLVLVEEPIRDEMARLQQRVIFEAPQTLNAVLRQLRAQPPDPEQARRHLERARDLLQSGQVRFDEFGTEEQAATFEPVTSLLVVQFDFLERGADALEELIEFDEEHGAQLTTVEMEERRAMETRLARLIRRYNGNGSNLAQRIEVVLERLFDQE
ncbi:MAG: vWA domain-containing protein [Actinomycetota bacterium]